MNEKQIKLANAEYYAWVTAHYGKICPIQVNLLTDLKKPLK